MGRVLNDIDDGLEQYVDETGQLAERPAARVLPHLDYTPVRRGQVVEIPDEDVYHWVAGGFTALDRYPVPHRLYPNHRADPLAYALPEPHPSQPGATAVGTPPPAVPAPAAQSAAAPAATPSTSVPADTAADSPKEQ